MSRSTRPRDLHVTLDPDARTPLRWQLAIQIRDACRTGRLPADTSLPASRELARQLGVSRGVVTDAYGQLAAEGYIAIEERRAPVVSGGTAVRRQREEIAPLYDYLREDLRWRFDLTSITPDITTFPREAWGRALRGVVRDLPVHDLDYGDPRGPLAFREAVCDYLARARGCDVDPVTTIAVSGFTDGLQLICRTLARGGARRIAMEDPGLREAVDGIRLAGLEPVPVPVDGAGIRVDLLARCDVQAVLVCPAHQFPTGVVMPPDRRDALLAWAEETGAVVIEDDYDAEFRYDRLPVGTLQGRAPERVAYVGSVSKTLAPALRIGWMHVPRAIVEPACDVYWHGGGGPPTIDLLAFASLLAGGDFERHLVRMRSAYHVRRHRLLTAFRELLPTCEVGGASAGLHLTLSLPRGADADAVAAKLTARRVLVRSLASYAVEPANAASALVVGYGRLHEDQVTDLARLLADVIGS